MDGDMATLPEDHKPVGTVSDIKAPSAWAAGGDRTDLSRLLPYLSEITCTMVGMRRLGHDWREIGEKLGIAPSTARKGFWSDMNEALSKIRRKNVPTGKRKRSGDK